MSRFSHIKFSGDVFFSFDQNLFRNFELELYSALSQTETNVLVLEVIEASPSMPYFVTENCLLENLGDRLFSIQKCILSIISSSKTSIFLMGDNCFDLNFEIALACDYRIAFRSNILFGFPSLKYDRLPLFFTFRNELLRSLRVKKNWSRSWVTTVDELKSCGLIDFYCEARASSEFLQRWIDKQLPIHPSKKDAGFGQILANKLTLIPDLRIESSAVDSSGHRLLSGLKYDWDAYWAQCKKVFESWEDLLAALENLRHDYGVSCFRGNSRAKVFQHHSLNKIVPSSLSKRLALPLLTISLDAWLPPSESILQALRLGHHLYFYSFDGDSLRQQLGLIFQRLIALGQSGEVEKLWQENCHWFVGQERMHLLGKCIDIEWRFNGEVVFGLGGNKLELLRLLSAENFVETGWFESPRCSLKDVDSALLEAAQSVSAGIIFTENRPEPETAPTVAHLVRNVILEGMFWTCQSQHIGWSDLLESFEREGWTIIGREGFWEKYVRLRFKFFGDLYPGDTANLGQRGESFQFNLWKEFRQKLARQNFRSPSRELSAYLSLSFTYLASALSIELLEKNYVKSLEDSDVLLTQSLGFPEKHGTPSFFIKRQGLQSTKRHIAEAFPNFLFDAFSSS